MPIDLPIVDDRTLVRPPLAVVVCQIRYEQNLRVGDGDTGLQIHEELGGKAGQYPVIEPQQIMAAQIEIGAAGVASLGANTYPRRGWRMRTADGKWTISLMPDFVALETTSYTTWHSDFRVRLAALIDAVARNIKPRIVERVGLRYVNRLSDGDRSAPADWQDVISDELLGPLASPFWSAGIEKYQSQVDLDLGSEHRCILRHGLVVDQVGQLDGYLLDLDLYRQDPERFDEGRLTTTLDELNTAAVTLFQKSLTDEYLEYLRTE